MDELDFNLTFPISSSAKATIEEFYRSDSNDDSGSQLKAEIKLMASQIEGSLISIRRMLHQYPELMYQEKETSRILQKLLGEVIGVPFTDGWAKNIHSSEGGDDFGGYGIVADIGTGQPPCVLLRADMDGLPILEETVCHDDIISKHIGQMHACGHDAHMAMLLGATAILKRIEPLIQGTVRVMFQPAEEGGAGAKRMVEEGVLAGYPPVQHAYAMHVWPSLPSGIIGGKPGSLLSAADSFYFDLCGIGGHAAMPHLTADPVVATSAIVMGAQTLISRKLSPLESGVLSITQVDTGGNANNVIPARVKIGGTIRALSTTALVSMREHFIQFIDQCAVSYGCNIENLTFRPDFYPPTINDTSLWPFASMVASSVSDTPVVEVPPTMGGEDFAFVAEKVPSAFFLLGQGTCSQPRPTNLSLHHPQFAVDERVLIQGVQLHVNLALRTLKKLSLETSEKLN